MESWHPFRDPRGWPDSESWRRERRSGFEGGPGMGQPAADEQIVPVNAFETGDDGLMVVAPMPGLQADDIQIRLADDVLTLQGRRTPGQEDRRHLLHEWSYGPYARTIRLPFRADLNDVAASLNNGILTVHLRRAPELRAHRIPVRVTTSDQRPPASEASARPNAEPRS